MWLNLRAASQPLARKLLRSFSGPPNAPDLLENHNKAAFILVSQPASPCSPLFFRTAVGTQRGRKKTGGASLQVLLAYPFVHSSNRAIVRGKQPKEVCVIVSFIGVFLSPGKCESRFVRSLELFSGLVIIPLREIDPLM